MGSPSTATATIVDDETASISVSSTVAAASEAGPVNGQFTVTLSQASYSNTTVSYTLSGAAANGADYTGPSGTVVILAGQTTATIDVTVSDDALLESPENVVLTLTTITAGDSGITLGAPWQQPSSLQIMTPLRSLCLPMMPVQLSLRRQTMVNLQ